MSTLKTEGKTDSTSQKKEEDQFFSVPEGIPEEMSNGSLILEKEKRILYRKKGGRWVYVEGESFELLNGDEIAIALNKDEEPELSFKVTYRFK